MTLSRARLSILVASLILTLAACGGSGSGGGDGSPATPPTVSDAWVLVPAEATIPAYGYMTITSTAATADWLIAATSPLAADIQLVEVPEGAAADAEPEPIDRIEIPAGGTVTLAADAASLQLLGVTELPAAGSAVELLLTFEEGGEVSVQAEARPG